MDERSLKRNALLVSVLSSFLAPFIASSLNVSLPAIGRDLSMDAVSLGWVATAYLLTAAAFLVPFGRASDIYGRKKIFIWGLAIHSLSSSMAGLVISGDMLIFWRVIQGIGSAMIFGTGITIVTSVYPANERGKALGIVLSAVYVGLSSGPFIGGVLTDYLGWRSVFFANVAIGVFALITTISKIRGDWREAQGESFDVVGSLIYVIAFTLAMYGLSRLPGAIGLILTGSGVAGLVLFVSWELRIPYPVLEVRLFLHNRPFLYSNIANLINYASTFAISFLLSLYLQYVRGYSAQVAGLVLVSQPVIQAIFSTYAGKISDRVEPRIIASAGMAILIIGLIWFAFLSSATGLVSIIGNLMFLGLGFALFVSPNTNAIMGSVDKKFYGVASGTLATMRVIGQTLSMGVVMLMFVLYMGKTQITQDTSLHFIESMRISFYVFAALSFLGLIASLVRGKIHK